MNNPSARPAAWRVEDRIGLGPILEERWLDKTPREVEELLAAKEPCDAPYTVTPLYAAPLPSGEPTREAVAWSDDYWQLDQAVMDAEQLPRPDVQIARLRAIRDRFAFLPPSDAPAGDESEGMRVLREAQEAGPYVRRCSICGEPDYPKEASTCVCDGAPLYGAVGLAIIRYGNARWSRNIDEAARIFVDEIGPLLSTPPQSAPRLAEVEAIAEDEYCEDCGERRAEVCVGDPDPRQVCFPCGLAAAWKVKRSAVEKWLIPAPPPRGDGDISPLGWEEEIRNTIRSAERMREYFAMRGPMCLIEAEARLFAKHMRRIDNRNSDPDPARRPGNVWLKVLHDGLLALLGPAGGAANEPPLCVGHRQHVARCVAEIRAECPDCAALSGVPAHGAGETK